MDESDRMMVLAQFVVEVPAKDVGTACDKAFEELKDDIENNRWSRLRFFVGADSRLVVKQEED